MTTSIQAEAPGIREVAVVGLGIMGAGIAEVLVRSGRAVVVTEASRNALATALPTLHTPLGIAREITAAAGAQPAKPIIAVFLTADPAPASPSNARIPTFTYPEEAAAALGQIARWANGGPGPPTMS